MYIVFISKEVEPESKISLPSKKEKVVKKNDVGTQTNKSFKMARFIAFFYILPAEINFGDPSIDVCGHACTCRCIFVKERNELLISQSAIKQLSHSCN